MPEARNLVPDLGNNPGHELTEDLVKLPETTLAWTADSTVITADSTTRTADEE